MHNRSCLYLFTIISAGCITQVTLDQGSAVDNQRIGPDVTYYAMQDVGLPGLGRVAIRHVGLPEALPEARTASVPPSGEGVAPIAGAGGDGLPVVTGSGTTVGGSSGPGAVRWHGGQWLIPYGGTPGVTITNMWCLVSPSLTATDTIELIGMSGVIGAVTVPAANPAQTAIQAWILPTPGYVVPDGGPIVVRHSPRDSTTGAWTSAAQDLTVIGCAVNARKTHTYKLTALGGASVGAGGFQVLSGQLTGNWYPVNDGDLLGISLPVSAGERFESIVASVYGNTAYTVTMAAFSQDDAFHGVAKLGLEQTSSAGNTLQPLTVVPLANDNSGNNEQVTTSQRSYSLQFRAHRLGAGDGGSLFVGPITLVTSTAN